MGEVKVYKRSMLFWAFMSVILFFILLLVAVGIFSLFVETWVLPARLIMFASAIFFLYLMFSTLPKFLTEIEIEGEIIRLKQLFSSPIEITNVQKMYTAKGFRLGQFLVIVHSKGTNFVVWLDSFDKMLLDDLEKAAKIRIVHMQMQKRV